MNIQNSLRLQPGIVYLTQGTVQQIRWLHLDLPSKLLIEPTTIEFESELSLDTGQPRQIIIIPKGTAVADKSKDNYAIPVDTMLSVADTVYAYVSSEYLSMSVIKKLYSYLESDAYISLDLTNYPLANYPQLESVYSNCDVEVRHEVDRFLSLYPKDAYYYLKENLLPPICASVKSKLDSVIDLVLSLRTKNGVNVWRNLTRQQLYLLFEDTRLVSKDEQHAKVSEFQRVLGNTKPNSKFPTGQCTQLSIWFAPFAKAYQDKYADEDNLYPLIQFAHWVYVASTRLATGEFRGLVEIDNPRYGTVNFHCSFSPAALSYWSTLVNKL